MYSFKRILLPMALLAGVMGCAPLPGEKFLERGYQSSLQGNWDDSIKATNEALEIAVDGEIVFLAYSSRCEFRIWKGRYDIALEDCNDSIRAKPGYSGYPYAARARIFSMMGQYEWALEEFDMAIDLGASKLLPGGNNPKVMAYGGKARVFATSTDQEFRDKERAVKFAQKAVEFEDRVKTPAYKILNRDTLAAAYAEAGRFDDAIKEQKNTIAMLKEKGWDSITYDDRTLLEILNRHLRQFMERKPLRGGIY